MHAPYKLFPRRRTTAAVADDPTTRVCAMASDHAAVATVTLADIQAAREVLRGTALVTPMEGARWLTAMTGSKVTIKCENLQRTGSFKIRGAYLRISKLSPEERARGVVAASAGNHAQGVALAAQLLGTQATVFMPHGA